MAGGVGWAAGMDHGLGSGGVVQGSSLSILLQVTMVGNRLEWVG